MNKENKKMGVVEKLVEAYLFVNGDIKKGSEVEKAIYKFAIWLDKFIQKGTIK